MTKGFKRASISPHDVHGVLSRYILADGFDIVVDIEKSLGSEIVCAKTGKPFLDLFSYYASCPLGMNHPKLANQEFIDRIGRAAINKITNSDVYSTTKAEFVQTFAENTLPKDFRFLFFIEGGTLAVENALKAAFDWKVRLNLSRGKGERGSLVIHFEKAFHGRSGYTLSITNTADPRKHMYFPKFDWPRIISPAIHFPVDDEEIIRVKKEEDKAIRQIKDVLYKSKDDVACLIIVPIQGEGGDRYFRREFLQELRTLADENEFLLIYDEIQTGMGMTGNWWALEWLDVVPDIFAFGKKSQVCGIASTERILEVKHNVFEESSRINSTWGGNIVDMVRATRFIEIIVEEDLLNNVKTTGDYILKELHAIGDERISNIRGKGFFAAFDLPDTKTRDKLREIIYKNGAIILSCGEHSIRFRPTLDFSKKDVDRAMHIIKKSLKEL